MSQYSEWYIQLHIQGINRYTCFLIGEFLCIVTGGFWCLMVKTSIRLLKVVREHFFNLFCKLLLGIVLEILVHTGIFLLDSLFMSLLYCNVLMFCFFLMIVQKSENSNSRSVRNVSELVCTLLWKITRGPGYLLQKAGWYFVILHSQMSHAYHCRRETLS
jgi:hypothetical protein